MGKPRDRPGVVRRVAVDHRLRRRAPDWVAFGDDAAAAAGICTLVGEPDAPLFCADAYADPVTGVHAALIALAGVSGALDLSMRDVVAHMLAGAARHPVPEPGSVTVAPPCARTPQGRAPAAGAHTAQVFRSLGLPSPR